MSRKYTMWLCPPAGSPTRQALESTIQGFSASQGGPSFTPHVTLCSQIWADDVQDVRGQVSAYIEKLRQHLSGDLTSIPIAIRALATGSGFYECVFLEVERSKRLAAARDIAIQHWDVKNPKPYRPHISLVYGNHSLEKLKDLATQVAAALPAGLPTLSYDAAEICLSDETSGVCETWFLAGSVPFMK
ncbi:hypothetical protein GGF46_002467 [Coemansia sp. RSA 552]|nr:hypothetical protein GGF46_002467 [Coemansia sp. RSA 552]